MHRLRMMMVSRTLRGSSLALAVAFALAAAGSNRALAQTTTGAVSRSEASARVAPDTATSRFFSSDDMDATTSTVRSRGNYFSNYFNNGGRNFEEQSGRCTDCRLVGASDIFAAPLFDNCDVFLFESLFDRAYNFEVSGQATILNQTVSISNNGAVTVPVPTTTTSLELSNRLFSLVFEQVNRKISEL